MNELRICPSPAANVVLTRYDEEVFLVFKFFFETFAASSSLHDIIIKDPKELAVSIVLENRSEQDITGLRYRWGMVDQTGKHRDRKVSNDSYMVDVYRPIVPSGSRLFISPSASLDETIINHVLAGGSLIGAFTKKNTDALQPESFEIDLVLFADGEITGHDPDGYAAELQCRKPAAEYVAKQIRLAEAEGRDVTPVLTALAEIPSLHRSGHGRVDPLVHWSKHYARRYLRDLQQNTGGIERREAGLRHLENRPTLPRFYRRPQ